MLSPHQNIASNDSNQLLRITRAAACLLLAVGLAACGGGGGGGTTTPVDPPPVIPAILKGTVQSGSVAVAGSKVVVYLAGATAGEAPKQVAQTTTDSTGNFSFTSFSPAPVAGQLVYVVAIGGNAGGGTNSAAALMAVPGLSGSATYSTNLVINELSTVAVTAQLQSFLTEGNCASISGSTLTSGSCPLIAGAALLETKAAGLTNLINPATATLSTFLTTAADGNALNTTARKLNFLSNVLASCVRSVGGVASDGSACGRLFSAARSSNNTISAAWHLANDFVANTSVATIFGFTGLPPAFSPTLLTAPANWSVGGIQFLLSANSRDGTVSVFAVTPSNGQLSEVAASPFEAGVQASSVAITASGRFAYVANSGDNTLSAYTIDPGTGTLTEISGSPYATGKNPSAVSISTNDRFVYVTNADSNTLSAYSFDTTNGTLTALAGSPFAAGASPQALALSPNGKLAYVGNVVSTAASNEISAYSLDSNSGAISTASGSPFARGLNPIAIAVAPNGKFAFAVNYSTVNGSVSDSISAYTVDQLTGALTEVAGSPFETGVTPSALAIAPSSKFVYVANFQDSTVTVFSIDATTGVLTELTTSPFDTGTDTLPQAIAISPSGSFLYVASLDGTISAYNVDVNTGALTVMSGGPFAAGDGASALAIGP